MKKNKLGLLLVMVLTGVMFFSCSKDDDDISGDNIVGTWKRIARSGWDMEDGEKEEWSKNYSADFQYYQFNNDGTGKEFWDDEDDEYPFSWSIKDKKLTIKDMDGDTETLTILTLNSTTLEIEESGKGDSYEWYEKTTFTRIK